MENVNAKNGLLEEVRENIILTLEELLNHWQGHRKLTRRVIEAFPEDKLFEYSIGGMRPFSELALEMIQMTGNGIQGVVTKKWKYFEENKPNPKNKEEFLRIWDEVTELINKRWSEISTSRFQEVDVAFGKYEGKVYSTIFYFIDNEIHHRGQGYVYLRSLGIEPPAFWNRDSKSE